MSSSLRPRIYPLLTVLVTVCWLFISAKELIQHPEKDYINEVIGLFLAIAGLSQIGEAKKDLQNFFKTLVVRVSSTGDVICQEHWKRCLRFTVSSTSKAARKKLARLVRDGHMEWIFIEDEKMLAGLYALKDQGINIERGDAPDEARKQKFKAGLVEFSSRCNFLKVPFLRDLSKRYDVSKRLLNSDEIAEVCLGLARQIYAPSRSDGWEADAISTHDFSAWGIHSNQQERPRFRIYFADASITEFEEWCGVEAGDLKGARLEVYVMPASVIVRDYLPSMLKWSLFFTENVRKKGGTVENIGDYYWDLLYWTFELRPRLDLEQFKAAQGGPSFFDNPSVREALERYKKESQSSA